MSGSRLVGFYYKNGEKVERSRREWREEVEKIVSAGGWTRMINGDYTAFDGRGEIVFEIYDWRPKQ